MSSRFLRLVIIVFLASACAQAQAPEPRVCTDLSGKYVLRCPQGNDQADSLPTPAAAGQVSPTVPAHPQSVPAVGPRNVSLSTMPTAAAKPRDGGESATIAQTSKAG